jgi:hypothetical protein
MVKLQALVVTPALLLFVCARRPADLLRVALGAGLVAGAALLPYALIGQAGLVLRRSIALIAGPSWLTVNALNLWYLVTGGAGNWRYDAPLPFTDADPLIAGVGARPIGLVLLALWVLGVCGWAWRHRAEGGRWVLAAALLYVGVFFFPTQAHERYAFGAVVLGWLWGGSAGGVGLPLALTALHTANLLWAAPVQGARLPGLLIAVGWAVCIAFSFRLARPPRSA